MNNTISISNLNNHGDPHLLCRPAGWTDIAVFYLGNYVAHAATIKSKPGQSLLSTILTIAMALLFPTSGIIVGLESISTMAIVAATDLRAAARAGALCMVVKYPERRREGDSGVEDVQEEEKEETNGRANDSGQPGAEEAQKGGGDLDDGRLRKDSIRLISTKVHTRCVLPDNYTLFVIPTDAEFEDDPVLPTTVWKSICRAVSNLFKVDSRPNTTISCSYSFVKILVSIGQTIFASATLYRTKGDQISQYGYAAFGLTVAPFAWMSLLNLLGNLLCPEYPAMYLVESESLDQLRDELASNGNAANFPLGSTVGRITNETEQKAMENWRAHSPPGLKRRLSNLETPDTYSMFFGKWSIAGLYVGAVPLALYGVLSKFHKASSTTAQRAWTMIWLVFGFAVGALIGPIADVIEGRPVINSRRMERTHKSAWKEELLMKLFMAMFYAAPAIGGYVVVGQMILSYGVCFRIQ